MDVHLDELAPVHVGVGLHGADKSAHLLGRGAQLLGQRARGDARPRSRRWPRSSPDRRAPARRPATRVRRRRWRVARRGATAPRCRTPRAARAARPPRRRRRARRAPSAPEACSSAWRCSATSCSASSRSMPASTNCPIVSASVVSASAMSAEARWAAAAGLFSSCASPAAIVPSDSSRSRFCPIAATRLTTGRIWRMTRWCTGRCSNTRSRKSSGAMKAKRDGSSTCMRTVPRPSGEQRRSHPSRSAPSDVPPARCGRPRRATMRTTPSSRRCRPCGSWPCSEMMSPGW